MAHSKSIHKYLLNLSHLLSPYHVTITLVNPYECLGLTTWARESEYYESHANSSASCIKLDKLLSLSKPHFPSLYRGNNICFMVLL